MTFSEDGSRLVVEAPAKINLYLKIVARRPDGYHEIDSLMQKLALVDVLRICRGEKGIHLSCPGSDLPADEGNLAFRAARFFFDHTGLDADADIVLEKKIPVAAGLGGGSSDAAAVLKGLNRLYQTGLKEAELAALASPLGADVPFFVREFTAAHATGIGDRLQEAEPLSDCQVVLVNPGFPVSTRWVYGNLALTSGGNPYILARGRETETDCVAKSHDLSAEFDNDLEAVTIKRYPVIDDIKPELRQTGADRVLMSGSGPTVFGLFYDPESAARAYGALSRRYAENVYLTTPYN